MPRIGAETIAEHREAVWAALRRSLDDLLAIRSFDEISLRDIAANAGIARNTIYNYAPDKVQLLSTITAHASADLSNRVDVIADERGTRSGERLAQIIELLLGSFSRDTHRAFVLREQTRQRSDRDNPATKPLVDVQRVIARLLDEGIASGEFDPGVSPSLDVVLLSGLMEASVRQIVQTPRRTSAITDRTKRLVLAAITARN